MKQMFFNTLRRHEYTPRDISAKWRARNEQGQDCLVQFMAKKVTFIAPASVVGLVIGHKVIPTLRVLSMRTEQGSAPADDPERKTVSLDESQILPVELPQKRQRMASLVGATQSSVDLISITPRKRKRKRKRNHPSRSVAPLSSESGLFDCAQRDYLPVGCTTQTHFQDGLLMDWVRNERRRTKFFVSRVVIEHLFVSAFPEAAMLPARHYAYVVLSMRDVEMLRSIHWYCAACDFLWGTFPKLSTSVVTKKTFGSARSGFGIPFFRREESVAHAARFHCPARRGRRICCFKGSPSVT